MTVIKIVPMPGVAGPTGDRGERGLQGEPGQNGLAGASAYATAVGHGFSGSESQWLASLVGQPGAKGDKGDTGNTGLTGASAYQTAISNGFSGSESQWLASLVGPKGDKGDRGDQGLQGIQGIQGPKGDTGATPTVTTTGSYTPVLSGTGLSITNNLATGNYTIVGNLVFFRIKVPLTYVANFGTGSYSLTLPFAPAADFIVRDGIINDVSAAVKYTLSLHGTLGSTSVSLKYSAGSQFYDVDYNSPVVLATADSFIISGTYERQA